MLSAPSYNDNKKFEKVAKRADSSNFRIDNMTANAWKLVAGEGFKRIISNLQQQHLCNARMIRGNFEYLLPQNDWSEHQIKVFQALQQAPIIVPTSNLKEVLSLESSTITSELTSPGHHFYVRSWTLARKELEDVLHYMTDEDQTFEETAQWRKVLDLYTGDKGPKFFTIRYVGTCEGPKRPYDRYAEDLKTRVDGILHEFVVVLEQLFPLVAAAAEIHLIKQASLPFIATYNADDIERVLIELFGHSTLLNRNEEDFTAIISQVRMTTHCSKH